MLLWNKSKSVFVSFCPSQVWQNETKAKTLRKANRGMTNLIEFKTNNTLGTSSLLRFLFNSRLLGFLSFAFRWRLFHNLVILLLDKSL